MQRQISKIKLIMKNKVERFVLPYFKHFWKAPVEYATGTKIEKKNQWKAQKCPRICTHIYKWLISGKDMTTYIYIKNLYIYIYYIKKCSG